MTASITTRLGVYTWPLDSDEFTRIQMDTSHTNLESRAGGFYYGAALPAPAAQYERSLFYDTTNEQLFFFNGTNSSGSWVSLNDFINPTTRDLTLGNATATTVNKVTITAPATSATLTIANGKTISLTNTLTFGGTDGSTVAFGGGGTVAYVANKLNVFAATSSSELATVISDETGSGALVFATSPTLVTPSLGVATAVSVNKVQFTTPASSATLALADGSSLGTSGAFSITLTSTAATNITLPTTGTLATIANTETFTNKNLTDSNVTFGNSTDLTKRVRFDVSGVATGTTRVLTVPNISGTLITTADTGTVSNTMISAVDQSKVTGLQTWADGRYYTETEINNNYIYQWGNRPTGSGGTLTNARQIYVQTDAPSSAQDGDLWFDL